MQKIQERSIVTNIVLSIVTCGIYGIIWFISITDDSSAVGENSDFSGGKAVLFTLITCGKYGIYWGYVVGKNISKAKAELGMGNEDLGTLYLILMIFSYCAGVTVIITYCLAQTELNAIVQKLNGNNHVNA